ncbi:hypothetical protein D623_10011738 [Myotis brandtii]|uniref:Uncharacterized protein n=1 Tax=Myotis brandtii TaxID=109478 RepID=S7PQD3_MYOBR|nr:hypothetical protein D623_10011738 [Myotis brandtii]
MSFWTKPGLQGTSGSQVPEGSRCLQLGEGRPTLARISCIGPLLQSSQAFDSQKVEATDKIYRIPRGKKTGRQTPSADKRHIAVYEAPLRISFIYRSYFKKGHVPAGRHNP